jgi:hypothetical protein
MLVTMQNSELIRKLLELAGGDIDLVQKAIRIKAGPTGGADLQQVVQYIAEHRRTSAAAPIRQAAAAG